MRRRPIHVVWPLALLGLLFLAFSPPSARGSAAFRAPRYAEGLCAAVGPLAEGAAPVEKGLDMALGYVDHAGHWVIPPQYKTADDFSRGIARVRNTLDGPYYYIDTTGKRISDELAQRIQAGLLPVKRGEKWGFSDTRTGELVVEAKYDEVREFSEGLALVVTHPTLPGSNSQRWSWIDYTGREVIVLSGPEKPTYHWRGAGSFYEGLAAVSLETVGSRVDAGTHKMGFIDRTGKIAIEPQYVDAGDFHEGRAVVCDDKKCGYIDGTGKLVIPMEFERGQDFSEGLAAVQVSPVQLREPRMDDAPTIARFPRWGFIDTDGKFVIKPEYSHVTTFSHGRAHVSRDGFQGFVDHSGNVVLDMTGWSSRTSMKTTFGPDSAK